MLKFAKVAMWSVLALTLMPTVAKADHRYGGCGYYRSGGYSTWGVSLGFSSGYCYPGYTSYYYPRCSSYYYDSYPRYYYRDCNPPVVYYPAASYYYDSGYCSPYRTAYYYGGYYCR